MKSIFEPWQTRVLKSIFVAAFVSYWFCPYSAYGGDGAKPRVIAMTDGEVDDRCSMVRFLLHTNDIELVAIIQTNSVFQPKGWVAEKWLDKQVDAYEKVYTNLVIHDPHYPTPAVLRNKLYVGDNDPSHLVVDANASGRIPGMRPAIDPSTWKDTPGSDRIVEVLLDKDPRLVHIQAWGGGNTAVRAFYKLKTQFPAEYKRALSKVVMYNIWYQDGAGNYIEQHYPEVTLLLSHYFNSTWAYGSQSYTKQFVEKGVRNNHGDLGKQYVQDYISEGDSPAFLYSLGNGLRSDENPAYGGWGGLFYKVNGFTNVYRDMDKASYAQWIEAANRDFENRLNWCVASTYEAANHKPEIKLSVPRNLTVHSGNTVTLNASITDKDSLNINALWERYGAAYRQAGLNLDQFGQIMAKRPKYSSIWWQYKEAGTYNGMLPINRNDLAQIQFIAPRVDKKCTVHLILEVTDMGVPALTAYERVVVTLLP